MFSVKTKKSVHFHDEVDVKVLEPVVPEILEIDEVNRYSFHLVCNFLQKSWSRYQLQKWKFLIFIETAYTLWLPQRLNLKQSEYVVFDHVQKMSNSLQ